jgi:NAD(P)-dependent dehydrogenase (short-subunit alcohol dehydrogenase family)
MMNIDLTGQAAVVTGASRGTGLGVTRARTTSGAHVTAGALHSSADLDKLTAEGTVTAPEVDLADLASRAVPGAPRTRSG